MPDISTRAKNQEPHRTDSFDLRKHEREAVAQSVYGHSVALVAGQTQGVLGSAAAIRWNDHTLLITANHVIKGAKDSDLRFAPRPPTSISLSDGQDPQKRRLYRAEALPVTRRFCDEARDVAALVVPSRLEEETPLRFFDLKSEETLPRRMPQCTITIGFPADSRERLGPKAWAFAGHLLYAEPQGRLRDKPPQFLPRSNFLLKFDPADDGREPHGFSGAGIWCLRQDSEQLVWSPRLVLLGMATHYHARTQLLYALRIERVLTFLRRALP